MGDMPWHKNWNPGKGWDYAAIRDGIDVIAETVGAYYGLDINMDQLREKFRKEGVPEDLLDPFIDQFLNEFGYDSQGRSLAVAPEDRISDSDLRSGNDGFFGMDFMTIAIMVLLVFVGINLIRGK